MVRPRLRRPAPLPQGSTFRLKPHVFRPCYNSRMEISINGEPRQVADGTTIRALLEQLDMARRTVAIEVNEEIVPRSEHAQHALNPGDAVEIVHAIGGG